MPALWLALLPAGVRTPQQVPVLQNTAMYLLETTGVIGDQLAGNGMLSWPTRTIYPAVDSSQAASLDPALGRQGLLTKCPSEKERGLALQGRTPPAVRHN